MKPKKKSQPRTNCKFGKRAITRQSERKKKKNAPVAPFTKITPLSLSRSLSLSTSSPIVPPKHGRKDPKTKNQKAYCVLFFLCLLLKNGTSCVQKNNIHGYT